MISFRYHIVSIVSVFLALAIGVALGGGPLKGTVDNTLVSQVHNDKVVKTQLRAQISLLKDGNAFTDTFAQTVAPKVIGNTLRGRVVDVLVLPTARAEDVSGLTALVRQAGATVGGTLRLGNGIVDVANKQLVDALGSQLQSSAKDISLPGTASPYDRIGALIGRVVGTKSAGGAAVDSESRSILAGLTTANLVSADGPLTRRGSLLLMVGGADAGSKSAQTGANGIVTAIAQALAQQSRGVVVAGPAESARQDGLLAAIRADVGAARAVSTVDSVGRTAGQVVAVMALGQAAVGKIGQWGAVNASNGAMPGAATP